jgi:hypothetical protein
MAVHLPSWYIPRRSHNDMLRARGGVIGWRDWPFIALGRALFLLGEMLTISGIPSFSSGGDVDL